MWRTCDAWRAAILNFSENLKNHLHISILLGMLILKINNFWLLVLEFLRPQKNMKLKKSHLYIVGNVIVKC